MTSKLIALASGCLIYSDTSTYDSCISHGTLGGVSWPTAPPGAPGRLLTPLVSPSMARTSLMMCFCSFGRSEPNLKVTRSLADLFGCQMAAGSHQKPHLERCRNRAIIWHQEAIPLSGGRIKGRVIIRSSLQGFAGCWTSTRQCLQRAENANSTLCGGQGIQTARPTPEVEH